MKKVVLTRPPRKATETNAYVASVKEKNSRTKAPLLPPSKGGIVIGGSLPEVGPPEKIDKVGAVLDLAADLTVSQRRELLAKLALDAQMDASTGSRDKDMWATAVYDGLQTVIGAGDRGSLAPMLVKRALTAINCWRPVDDFMTASKLGTMTVTERQAIYKFLARLVIKRSREVCHYTKAPLSPKLVAGQAQHVAELFDAEFPGYLASGLAAVVAKRIVSGYQPPEADNEAR
jgi:hypothetical protein